MGDQVVTLADVVTADGLHGRGWYGPVAVRQPSLGRNYVDDDAFIHFRPASVLTILTLAFKAVSDGGQ